MATRYKPKITIDEQSGESLYTTTPTPLPKIKVMTLNPPLPNLIVKSKDPTALIEVKDNLGKVIKPFRENSTFALERRLEFLYLKAGFYRIFLLTPDGYTVEKIVDITPGDATIEVEIHPPDLPQAGLTSDFIKSGKFDKDEENSIIYVSETMGPIMNAKLSTILTLTGKLNNSQDNINNYDKIKNLGLRFMTRFSHDIECGVQILFGWESGDGFEALNKVRLCIWPTNKFHRDIHQLNLSNNRLGVGEFSTDKLLPGPHWLAVKIPGQRKPVIFYLQILPRRITMLVFHMDINNQLNVFQYLPSRDLIEDPSVEDENLTDRKFLSYRRLEFLEQFYLSGRLDSANQYSDELLKYKFQDPITGCLGGYLKLKLGKANELKIPSHNMINYYGQISDSYILMAEYEESLNNEIEAKKNFEYAIRKEFPICSDGLLRLQNGIKKYDIQDKQVKLLDDIIEKQVNGLLWTAWIPKDEDFGGTLF